MTARSNRWRHVTPAGCPESVLFVVRSFALSIAGADTNSLTLAWLYPHHLGTPILSG